MNFQKYLFKKFLLLICLFWFHDNKTISNIFINARVESGLSVILHYLKILTKKNPYQLTVDDVFIENIPSLPNNNFYFCHLPYGSENHNFIKKNNFKMLYLQRDLRDVTLARTFYIKNSPEIFSIISNLPIDYLVKWQMREVIELNYYFQLWLQETNCYAVKFEKLIGQRGGGTVEEQFSELKNIAKFIELKATDSLIYESINTLIDENVDLEINLEAGAWQQFFSEDNKKLFKQLGGQLLIELGYEKDLEW